MPAWDGDAAIPSGDWNETTPLELTDIKETPAPCGRTPFSDQNELLCLPLKPNLSQCAIF